MHLEPYGLVLGFSAPTLLKFGAENFFLVRSCQAHCGKFSSISGLCTRDARITLPAVVNNQKYLQKSPNVPGNKIIPVENHWSRAPLNHLQMDCSDLKDLGVCKRKKEENEIGYRLLFIPGMRTSTQYSKARMCNQSSFSFRNRQKIYRMKPEAH